MAREISIFRLKTFAQFRDFNRNLSFGPTPNYNLGAYRPEGRGYTPEGSRLCQVMSLNTKRLLALGVYGNKPAIGRISLWVMRSLGRISG